MKYILYGQAALIIVLLFLFIRKAKQYKQADENNTACENDLLIISKNYNAYASGMTPAVIPATSLEVIKVLPTNLLSQDGKTPC